MNIDSACVLLKEICIGKQLSAYLEVSQFGGVATLTVPLDNVGHDVRVELQEFAKSRHTDYWYEEAGLLFIR